MKDVISAHTLPYETLEPIFSGSVEGYALYFAVYKQDDKFYGELKEVGETDPLKVHRWYLPSLAIEQTMTEEGSITHIPAGQPRGFVGTLGADYGVEFHAAFVQKNFYANGIEGSSHLKYGNPDPLVVLNIHPDNTITLGKA